MVEIDEIIAIIIGFSTTLFILANYSKFKSCPGKNLIITAFLFALMSWIFSVIESILLEWFFNFLQHICISVFSILIAIWILVLNRNKE